MFLLDTCTLLWLAGGAREKLSPAAIEAMRRSPGLLAVSAISAFEIGIKTRQGKIELPANPRSWFQAAMARHGLHEIPVSGAIAAASTMLPSLHRDPCDRIIVATAQKYDLVVLTPDPLIARYPETRTSW